MAAGDLVYGSRTALANVSRLNSDASAVATAFGEVDNTSTLALDYNIHLVVPINASATTGTYELYCVASQEGGEWTDNIDPATDTNYANYIKDARLVRAAPTVYAATVRAEVEFHFNISEIFPFPPPYFGFVLKNSSGQAIPSSGSDGDSMSIKIATS